MRYVEAGGVRVSVIGLGTWQFGSTEWGYGSTYATGVAGDIVRRALDLGINLIDTAEIYGLGRSERIVGEAIGGRRSDVFVATKLFPVGLRSWSDGGRGRAREGSASTTSSCTSSTGRARCFRRARRCLGFAA